MVVAVSLWHWWLWVYAGGGCGFVVLMAMGLCQWWLWVCCGYEFGNRFMLVVAIGFLIGLCRWWYGCGSSMGLLMVVWLRLWLLLVATTHWMCTCIMNCGISILF